MLTAVNAALSGMVRAQSSLDLAAQRIASVPAEAATTVAVASPGVESARPATADNSGAETLEASTVALIEARNSFLLNSVVLKSASQMLDVLSKQEG